MKVDIKVTAFDGCIYFNLMNTNQLTIPALFFPSSTKIQSEGFSSFCHDPKDSRDIMVTMAWGEEGPKSSLFNLAA